jgi:hypothetical protein
MAVLQLIHSVLCMRVDVYCAFLVSLSSERQLPPGVPAEAYFLYDIAALYWEVTL